MFRPVRTRLLEELEQGLKERPKVLSIIAPMGYGKTILMSELHARLCKQKEACYWISLDDRHTSVDRVLMSMEAALSGPEADLHPTHALLRGDNPIESRVDELIEFIARHPAPTTIFIDNLNSCVDESLSIFLDALIFRTPASVRFVWSSTTNLAINLGRAKLEGLIRQVGFPELRFNAEELKELLGTKLTNDVGLSGIDAILRQTEGWPGAIRMAQIILENSDQPLTALASFSGSDEDVSALLNRQVLRGFTPELRNFLLSIAQLHTFGVDLCRHATGDDDAEQHLEFLLRRNVFVIPLDRNRETYRLHGLFRQYLLSEMERSISLEKRREILKRAAEWCEQNSKWRDAIEYALEAHEIALASRILDRTVTLFARDRGDIQQYIHWVERLQSEGLQLGWEAHFWYVWSLIFHRRYAAGSQQLEKLVERHRSHKGKANPPPEDLPQRIDLLRICIDLLTDRLADAHQGAERWLAAKKSSDPHNIGSVYCVKTICLTCFFRFAQARQMMRTAQQILFEIGGAVAIGWVHLINGLISIYEGSYANAYKELLTGLSRIRGELGEDSILSDTLALAAAKCALEMGLNDEARSLLHQGMRSAHSHGLVGTTACGFDAAVAFWSGSENDAISIPHLREIASSYPNRLSLMLSCYLVQRLLRLGRIEDARLEAKRIGLGSEEPESVAAQDAEELEKPRYRELFMATVIELHLARQQYREAESLIAKEYQLAQLDGRTARLVELGLARATIEINAGNTANAEKELTLAVGRAARQRIVRPFLDRAETVSRIVSDTRPSSWSFAQREEREFFAEICNSLPISNRLLHDWSELWVSDQNAQNAPTKREAELLSMLDMGLSNQQIADYSNVSITTIKWHLQNLYRKFGVTNRSAALARARALNLLPK